MYEEWFYNKLDPKDSQLMNCPVCKARLGYRQNGHPFMEHCEECKATFTWKMDNDLPKAKLDSLRKGKRCDCGRCD